MDNLAEIKINTKDGLKGLTPHPPICAKESQKPRRVR